MAFHIPTAEEPQAAIGDTGSLSKPMQRAFTPESDFDPIPPPQPGDWLTAHPEPGQSFAEFYRKLGFSPEAAWVRDRAAFIQEGDGL